jgi:hypothetical protein
MMSEAKRLTLTIREAREISGLTHCALYRALNAGVLDSRKILGRRLIVYSSLENLLLTRADSRMPSAFGLRPRKDGIIDSGVDIPRRTYHGQRVPRQPTGNPRGRPRRKVLAEPGISELKDTAKI